jgi:hypothetical protein
MTGFKRFNGFKKFKKFKRFKRFILNLAYPDIYRNWRKRPID